MSIRLEAVTTAKQLNSFVLFPFRLYKANPYWVPPFKQGLLDTLSAEKNPAFAHCRARYWLAYKGETIVGRIAGIVNENYIDQWGERLGRFGWIDFIDDAEVAGALLDTVELWLRESGMSGIIGPMGFTNFDTSGTLVDGFTELSTFGATFNYPYYAPTIEAQGYVKISDWVEYQMPVAPEIPAKVERLAQIIARRFNLHLFFADKAQDLLPYAHQVFEIMNETYTDIYGFVPLSDAQIEKYTHDYFGFIRPEYVPLIVNESGDVVAFAITIPSLAKAMQRAHGRLLPFGFWHIYKAMRRPRCIDFMLTAVRPEYQNKGVNAMLMYELHKVFLSKDIQYVETNWENEDNTKIQAQWRFYERRQHKRRRVFRKDFAEGETLNVKRQA
ncbi:GNAT family N-acetyltransferase [candidate division KSB1 bacterium]|nr:GNAT family N-acetyltransferase [candidate division KSB1 bacterium]